MATVLNTSGQLAGKTLDIAEGSKILSADPASPLDGTWWVVQSGTSPNMTVAMKFRMFGSTWTLSSVTL